MNPRRLVVPVFRGLLLFAAPALLASAWAQEQTIEDCVIEPNKIASVSSSVDGVIEKISVKRGELVKQGQVLIALSSRIEKATIELARVRAERDQAIKAKTARLEFTQRRLKRNQDLFEQNLISEQVVDEARTDALLAELELGEFLEERKIAELELLRAREALAIRTIRSPFAGVVVDVLVATGESVENRPLLKIASINPLNVEIIAPVELFGKIKKGMQATVIPEQPIGGEHTASVVIVDRVIDAASGTFGIRLQLSNRDYKLPAGLRCKVVFDDLKVSRADNDVAKMAGESAKSVSPLEPGSSTKASAGITPGEESSDDLKYFYTVYLFSTRSQQVAEQVNDRFRDAGHDSLILTRESDSVKRYRVAVTGFTTRQSAEDYGDAVAGTLGIAKAWVARMPVDEINVSAR